MANSKTQPAPKPTFSDEFFKLAGPRWVLAKALADQETGGNPWAVGDGGNAQGLFQMHWEFASDYYDMTLGDQKLSVALRGEPFVAIRLLAVFFDKHRALSTRDLVCKFHRGHIADDDPDGYIASVLKRLGGQWPV